MRKLTIFSAGLNLCSTVQHSNLPWKLLFYLTTFGLLWFTTNCGSSEISPPVSVSGGPEEAPAPAVIFMIGDGMGIAQVSAAMYSDKKKRLNLEQFPVIGFHKTFSSDNLVTDSAAGATAFSCGVKTANNFIGMNADTLPCVSILEQAGKAGLATGLIATSSIVHATPAAFAAHQPMRIQYEAIAADMIDSGVDLLIGGGRRYFNRRSEDSRNLVTELKAKGYVVSDFTLADLGDQRPRPDKPFVFFTADNHPLPVNQGRTYLSFAARIGSQYLNKRGENGFFLVIEGSQIDWANHAKEGRLAIEETLDFDRAVGEVLTFARNRGNTLVVVTADHESGGMAVAGRKRGRVKTAFTTNGHTATLVPVFAFGPQADMFAGIYDNTEIHHKMQKFLKLTDYGLTQD